MSGPTLLLLHAFPLDARMWDEVVPPLGARGLRTASPTLPVSPERRNLGSWAEDVLGAVEGSFVPVGVSVGGYLSFELWRRAPDRVTALVLCDTRAGAESAEGRAGRERTIATIRSRGPEAVWRELEDRVLSPAASRDVRERAAAIAASREPEELVATVEAIRDRPDSSSTLATISVPALVVNGEDDAIVPLAEAAALASAIPGARLRAIPQAGHLAPFERPAAFAAAVGAFLEDVL